MVGVSTPPQEKCSKFSNMINTLGKLILHLTFPQPTIVPGELRFSKVTCLEQYLVRTYLSFCKCILMLIVVTVNRKANSSISSKINSIVIYLPVLIVNVIFLKRQLFINDTKIFTSRFWFNLFRNFSNSALS